MITEITNYGRLYRIWNGGFSKDWEYPVRRVKVLNGCFDKKDQHPYIEKLAKREYRIVRKLEKRLREMEDLFRLEHNPLHKGDVLEDWERTNKKNFNEYFHDEIDNMIEKINDISRTYVDIASKAGLPWCW